MNYNEPNKILYDKMLSERIGVSPTPDDEEILKTEFK
jgi:hypothetical protein